MPAPVPVSVPARCPFPSRPRFPSPAVLLALLLACKDDPPTPDTAPAPNPTIETRELPPRDPPTIELLDPGVDPRTPLRLDPTSGTETPLDITLALRMNVRASGTEIPPIATPKVTVHGRLIVDAISAEEIRVRHLAESVELARDVQASDPLSADLARAIETFSAYRASLRVDRRGFLRGGTIDVPTGTAGPAGELLTQLGDAYGQGLVPLPEAPVGVGARWTATRDVDQGGMKLREVATYLLKSHEGGRIEVHADLEQTLRSADLDAAGVRAKMVKFSAHGRSDTTFDLAALAPEQSVQHTEVRMIMDVGAAGESLRQEIDLEVDLSLVRPGAP